MDSFLDPGLSPEQQMNNEEAEKEEKKIEQFEKNQRERAAKKKYRNTEQVKSNVHRLDSETLYVEIDNRP